MLQIDLRKKRRQKKEKRAELQREHPHSRYEMNSTKPPVVPGQGSSVTNKCTGKTTLKAKSCKLQIQQVVLLLLPKPRENRCYTALQGYNFVSFPNPFRNF